MVFALCLPIASHTWEVEPIESSEHRWVELQPGHLPRFSRKAWLLTWQLGSDTALGGLLSARESVSEGSDNCFFL